MGRVGFARWRSDAASGGNRYDDELSAGLTDLGVDLREYAVDGPWPLPLEQDRRRLAEVLTREHDWLIDNIVGSAAPQAIAEATTAGRRVTLLVHYFPADDPAVLAADRQQLAVAEAEAIAAATNVIVTSAWAAGQIEHRYGRTDAVVAVPGVAPADIAPGSGNTPAMLWLARLTPTKDPSTFVRALERVADLRWTARIVGPDTVDAELAREVRAQLQAAGLEDRVAVPGPLTGADLDQVWAASDLLVHTSRQETFGMVVTEALSRAIPAIVPAGTGAVEAQQVGETFPPGDAEALATGLRRWLSDPGLRRRWREEAVVRRDQLPTWSDTARIVADVLAPPDAVASDTLNAE